MTATSKLIVCGCAHFWEGGSMIKVKRPSFVPTLKVGILCVALPPINCSSKI